MWGDKPCADVNGYQGCIRDTIGLSDDAETLTGGVHMIAANLGSLNSHTNSIYLSVIILCYCGRIEIDRSTIGHCDRIAMIRVWRWLG